MDIETGRGPSRLRRAMAVAAALLLGAALSALGTVALIGFSGLGSAELWGFAWGLGLLLATWGGCPFAAVAVHDWILRRSGAQLPPPRTPRDLRAPIAWMLGSAVGAGPMYIGVFGYLIWQGDAPPQGWSTSVILAAGAFSIVAGPTVGVLVTRALCRRWAAPPPASPAASGAAPAPAPAPLPVRPEVDPPSMPFLPAPA